MSAGYANMSTKTLAGDFKPTFALDLAHKDLRLALELADELGVPGLIAPQVMSLMRMARGMGLGHRIPRPSCGSTKRRWARMFAPDNE